MKEAKTVVARWDDSRTWNKENVEWRGFLHLLRSILSLLRRRRALISNKLEALQCVMEENCKAANKLWESQQQQQPTQSEKTQENKMSAGS